MKFHAGLRTKQYKSISDLRNEFAEDPKTLANITKQKNVFDDFVTQFITNSYEKLPSKPVRKSLEEYCYKNPLKEGERPLSDERLRQLGLYDILAAVLEVVVIAEDPKLGTIILHGEPNCGKSSIMAILNEIFICDYMKAS